MRKNPKKTSARIHLAPLSGHEALIVANIFEKAIAAIWRAHGDAMSETIMKHLGDHFPNLEEIDEPISEQSCLDLKIF